MVMTTLRSIQGRMGRLLASGLVAVGLMAGVVSFAPKDAEAAAMTCRMAAMNVNHFYAMARISFAEGEVSDGLFYVALAVEAQQFFDENCSLVA